MYIFIATLIAFAAGFLFGQAIRTPLTEDVLDQLDTLDELENRIREARIYMAEKPSFPAEDYDYLCRILDPEDTYKYNNLNDF